MLIYTLDDEILLLQALTRAVRIAAPDAEIRSFRSGMDALASIEAGEVPDVVFSDIEMPGLSGLELGARIKIQSPATKIVFVTGFSQYALEAYHIHAKGYILKPVDPERIREELDLAFPEVPEAPDRLEVRCFGYFEVFYGGSVVPFPRKKSKELLAYLVDREGEFCSFDEILEALWEGAEKKGTRSYVRVLTSDLSKGLAAVGMESVLIRKRDQWAVDRSLLDCDYYRMLEGDMAALNSFSGSYMQQYSWAQMTIDRLKAWQYQKDAEL